MPIPVDSIYEFVENGTITSDDYEYYDAQFMSLKIRICASFSYPRAIIINNLYPGGNSVQKFRKIIRIFRAVYRRSIRERCPIIVGNVRNKRVRTFLEDNGFRAALAPGYPEPYFILDSHLNAGATMAME
jgi:hypothetical protein